MKYKSKLDQADKSTIRDTSRRALILHGGKTLEHERLIRTGFNRNKIDSVEIKQEKHDQFISQADLPLRNNAHRANVHQFIRSPRAFSGEYSYVHLDFNGHFVNGTNQRGVLNTLSELQRILAKDTVARVRFTVSDSKVRNRNSKHSSQENEWTNTLYEWYARNFTDFTGPLPVARGKSPSMLFFMCLAASLTLGVQDLETFVREPSNAHVRLGIQHRPVMVVAYESYCDTVNYTMHTCWFDIGKPIHDKSLVNMMESVGKYVIWGLSTFIRKEKVKRA